MDPKKRIVVEAIEFGEVVQFPRVLRAATSALDPSRLLVALLMVVAVVTAGRIWDANSSERVPPGGLLPGRDQATAGEGDEAVLQTVADAYDLAPPPTALEPDEFLERLDEAYRQRRRERRAEGVAAAQLASDDRLFLEHRAQVLETMGEGIFEATASVLVSRFRQAIDGVIRLRPRRVLDAGADVFVRLPAAVWGRDRAFAVFFGVVSLVVIALGGAGLCRMAACAVAGRPRLRVPEAVEHVLSRWVRVLLTPILPLLLAALVAVLMVLMGLLMLPWVDVVGGLLHGLALVLGFLLAFLLIGYALSWPLLLPAIACEDCDPAEAQQRAYAYLLNRPLHLLWYATVALLGLVLGYLVVALVAATMLDLTAQLVGVVTGHPALVDGGGPRLLELDAGTPAVLADRWHERWAATLVTLWRQIVVDLVVAYVVSYFFTASTIAYLLMRKACDGQDVEDIWRPGLVAGTGVPADGSGSEAASAGAGAGVRS